MRWTSQPAAPQPYGERPFQAFECRRVLCRLVRRNVHRRCGLCCSTGRAHEVLSGNHPALRRAMQWHPPAIRVRIHKLDRLHDDRACGVGTVCQHVRGGRQLRQRMHRVLRRAYAARARTTHSLHPVCFNSRGQVCQSQPPISETGQRRKAWWVFCSTWCPRRSTISRSIPTPSSL